jgi:protein-S-isoprenylcysteine O-methyltransferase Ste14
MAFPLRSPVDTATLNSTPRIARVPGRERAVITFRGRMRFLSALFAFIALPGIVAGLVPWAIVTFDPGRSAGHTWGWIVLALGIVMVLWCVCDFYVSGRGTLAPWDPPKRLVIVGLYRFTRNPMYLGVLLTIAGARIGFGSPLLKWYFVGLVVAFHLRVVLNEEAWLLQKFASEWERYREHVPRWLPRLTPWRG